jgi:hypothetical protein
MEAGRGMAEACENDIVSTLMLGNDYVVGGLPQWVRDSEAFDGYVSRQADQSSFPTITVMC